MIKKIAVIGSGVMGCGIAQSFAAQGYPVAINDIKQEFLDKAKQTISSQLDFLVRFGSISMKQKSEALKRCTFTTNLEQAVKDADWVIEAIPEVIEMKWSLYEKLNKLAATDAILSSNTSTFPLSLLIKPITKRSRFFITHFFNPAHLVPLVEIVKGETTDTVQVDEVVRMLKEAGKQPVLLKKEINGFIANRLQTALMREAFALISQGVADPQDVDRAVTEGIGFRWAFLGPTRIADLGGLDTWKRVFDNIAPDLDKSTGAPELINQQVAAHLLGAKTGKGLYDYDGETVHRILEERDQAFVQLAKAKS